MADRVVPMDVRAAIVNWPEGGAPRGAVSRFCVAAGISRSQFYEIRRRVESGGPVAAMSPRPRIYREPHPQAIPVAIEELAVTVRKELADQGLDHGPVTVRWHLQQMGVSAPAASTLARVFTRRGMVTPQPQKRPRSSYRRFEFAMVHECWQIDAFEWPLATDDQPPLLCVIYQVLDDRSRFMLATRVGAPGVGENSADAIGVVNQAIAAAGRAPCLFLSDNGVAFNRTRLGQTSQLVTHLKTFGTRPITGRPGHPQTQGKDERAHQTLQRWLSAHPARTWAEMQAVVDGFDKIYNHRRPHQSLGMRTPEQAKLAGPIAPPPRPPDPDEHDRPGTAVRPSAPVLVRQRKIAKNGNLIVRRHIIQMGLEASGTTVTVLTSGATVNIFHASGEHLRSVVLVPGQRYYGNGKKSPGGPKHREPSTLT